MANQPFAEELAALARQNFCLSAGAMYGSARDLAVGAGVIVRNVRYAAFDQQRDKFIALKGAFFVLTHECDIDQNNRRGLNSHFIGVPLLTVDAFARAYEAEEKRDDARSLIVAIAKGLVSRAYLLPCSPFDVPELEQGAIVYLNAITSCHLAQLSGEDQDKACALSSYGLNFADMMLKQHLLRPKSDVLASYGNVLRPNSIHGPSKPNG